MRSRISRFAAAVMFTAALFGSQPGLVTADCDGPIPSFRDALSTAKRIVIGDVVAVHGGGQVEPGPGGRSTRFTLRVRFVPRGSALAEMVIRDLPTQPCAPIVEARIGDRIALALEATDYSPPTQVNSVAWIEGVPPWEVETMAVPRPPRTRGISADPTYRRSPGLLTRRMPAITPRRPSYLSLILRRLRVLPSTPKSTM